MKPKEKPCKGINKGKGYGCGVVVLHRTYGLCPKCFKSWLFATSTKAYIKKLKENEEAKRNRR